MALIERRVAQLYAHFAEGAEAGQPLLPFAAYLREEEDYRSSAVHEKARLFWRDAMARDLPVLQKGSEDYPATPLCAEIELSDLTGPLRAAGEMLDIGEADLLTLLTGIWLRRHPCSPDHKPESERVIWLPYMSRFGSVSARIPAMVVNIFPFTVTDQAGSGMAGHLSRLARSLRRHRRHGRYRIEQMAKDRGLNSRQRFLFSPLVNVMPFDMAVYPGCATTREVLAAGPADGFNMTFSVDAAAGLLSLWMEADPALTPPDLFGHHLDAFPDFLREALAELCAAQGAVEITSRPETVAI